VVTIEDRLAKQKPRWLMVAVMYLPGALGCNREIEGNIPLTQREISPSELGPENVDLSSFDGSYRMWRRLVCYYCMLNAPVFVTGIAEGLNLIYMMK